MRHLDLLVKHDELAGLGPARRRAALRELLVGRVPDERLGPEVEALADRIDGLGPLTPLLADDAVTDVLVNGPGPVWVERAGRLQPSGVELTAGELDELVELVCLRAELRVDHARPIGDGALPSGERVHVVLPPLAPGGPLVSLRRFARRLSLGDLEGCGFATAEQVRRLAAAVAGRRTVLVCGPTGTGKTTLLGALIEEVPADERVVTIEETPELRPRHPHVVALVGRPPNVEGAGEVGLAELARAALRMRPDRIVLGEVRGPEAAVALAAMAAGHRGTLLTLHAGSASEALERLVTLALEARTGATEAALRERAAAVEVVAVCGRAGGRRRLVELWER